MEGTYNSANVLPESECDGWVLGLIGVPWPGPWPKLNGDLFVVSPDGWQAGLAWENRCPELELIQGPSESRWGVYQVHFPHPVMNQADLVRNFHSVLPLLQSEYAKVKQNWQGEHART